MVRRALPPDVEAYRGIRPWCPTDPRYQVREQRSSQASQGVCRSPSWSPATADYLERRFELSRKPAQDGPLFRRACRERIISSTDDVQELTILVAEMHGFGDVALDLFHRGACLISAL